MSDNTYIKSQLREYIMSTLIITTYQSSGIDREEPTDFPINTETFSTQEQTLEASIAHYLTEEEMVDDVTSYLSELTIGADGSYYKEEDQVLIGYSLK